MRLNWWVRGIPQLQHSPIPVITSCHREATMTCYRWSLTGSHKGVWAAIRPDLHLLNDSEFRILVPGLIAGISAIAQIPASSLPSSRRSICVPCYFAACLLACSLFHDPAELPFKRRSWNGDECHNVAWHLSGCVCTPCAPRPQPTLSRTSQTLPRCRSGSVMPTSRPRSSTTGARRGRSIVRRLGSDTDRRAVHKLIAFYEDNSVPKMLR